MKLAAPINIYSGASCELGAALTNPTLLAKEKGCLSTSYPVVFNNKRYPDAETAYHLNKEVFTCRDSLMEELLVVKLRQYPLLAKAIEDNGGEAWILSCSHLTQSQREVRSDWEGVGVESRFIRALAKAYTLHNDETLSDFGQQTLF